MQRLGVLKNPIDLISNPVQGHDLTLRERDRDELTRRGDHQLYSPQILYLKG